MILYLLFFIAAYIVYAKSLPSRSKNAEFLMAFFIIAALFVGIADMMGGYDRYIYANLFDSLADDMNTGGSVMGSAIFEQYTKELGYDFFNVLIALITKNRYIFIFITTICIYVLLYQSFKRYVENYPFGIILFLALMFFFTFTYLRQMLGIGIAWLSIRYIIQRRIWPFMGVMLVAFLFHNSALIFFPMYFVPMKKFSQKKVVRIMAICFFIGISPIPTALFAIFGEVSDSGERVAGYVEDTSGFRLTYLIEAVFFLYFILSRYRMIPKDPKRIVLLNMSFVFCGILLFFIKSENGGRLGWYYLMGLFSTLSYLASKSRCITRHNMMLIVVCLFLFLRILHAWGILLVPYKTFFTKGHNRGDFIYEKYEYDFNYDKNKFYR